MRLGNISVGRLARLALSAFVWGAVGWAGAIVVGFSSSVTWADEPNSSPTFSAEDLDYFEKKVRPVLVQRCFECHGANEDKRRGGLRLDHRAFIIKGGETGPAAVSGDPSTSLLIEAIGYKSAQIEMPPSGKLPDAEITVLTEWVRRGLPFPTVAAVESARGGVDFAAARQHWAFRPWNADGHAQPDWLAAGQVTARGSTAELPRSRVDVYLRASMTNPALAPSAAASRAVLVRRLKFDLLGLPPTPEEVDAFVTDDSPDAYERLVDRWLASPQFGERWARYWLDLARYCDIPESWREGEAKAWLYRDWVVQATNADLPYDQFVIKQLAADLLPDATPAENAALGMLGLSPAYWKELKLDHLTIKQVVADEWEERIEALGATFLGLTLACARCHDHKYDPITVQDYYALAGVLASVKQDDVPVVAPDLAAAAKTARARVKAIQQEVAKLQSAKPVTDENQQKIDSLNEEATRLREKTPHFDTPYAFGVVEASMHVLPDGPNRTKLEYRAGQPQDLAVQIRGNPSKTGAVVPRRFVSLLSRDPESHFSQGSGRLELAQSIVTDAQPLVARVAVNRLWLHHFGRGFVATPSNFGLQTKPPAHLALLDELAERFAREGWSTKRLHRELVTTAAYRQSSDADAARMAVDPDNASLWRMSVRRLDVESWRDAMLAVADRLDLRTGGAPTELLDATNHRRTLYGVVKRRELNDLLRLYDFPDPVSHAALREPTTTPLQQLFVLNSPFMRQRSAELAARVLADRPANQDGATDVRDEQIRWAYRLLYGRPATDRQVELGGQFLASLESAGQDRAAAWQQYAQVLLSGNELLFVP